MVELKPIVNVKKPERTNWGGVIIACLLILTTFAYCARVELFC